MCASRSVSKPFRKPGTAALICPAPCYFRLAQQLPTGDIARFAEKAALPQVQSNFISQAIRPLYSSLPGIAGGPSRALFVHVMTSIRYALAGCVLLIGYCSSAQELALPDAPSHKFFDRQNTAAFAALGGLIAADAVATQRLTNSAVAQEANPLWRPLVRQGWQGEMAASALGYSAALGVAYTFHKTGHHKIERWANWLTVAMEVGNDVRSLYVARSH